PQSGRSIHRQSSLSVASNSGALAASVPGARSNSEVKVRYSKRLPQSNKDLCCFNAGHRTQIAADVDPDWAHWCRISKANADRVAILTGKVLEPDTVENISAVIESDEAQTLL